MIFEKKNIVFMLLFVVVVTAAWFYFFSQKNQIHSVLLTIWGRNDFGQLATGDNKTLYSFDARSFNLNNIVSLSSGYEHVLALSSDGSVYSWGNNESGQLGIGSNDKTKAEPQKITINEVKKIAASKNHSIVLKKDGTVWVWGNNFSGQLGTGDHQNKQTPVQIKDLSDVQEVYTGERFSLALKKDGTLWGWGGLCLIDDQNAYNEFLKTFKEDPAANGGYFDTIGKDNQTSKYTDCIGEDNMNIKSLIPIKLYAITDVKDISIGYGHVLILKNDGSVWSWGCNKYGQTGNGTFVNDASNRTLFKVPNLTDIQAISAGFRHSMALDKAGNVYTWGHNLWGELGVASTKDIASPIRIKELDGVTKIVASHDYSLAVLGDGLLYGWGENKYRKLSTSADEFGSYFLIPKKVRSFDKITNIVAGEGHILMTND